MEILKLNLSKINPCGPRKLTKERRYGSCDLSLTSLIVSLKINGNLKKQLLKYLDLKRVVNFRRLEKALAEELISKFERAKGTEAEEPLHEEMKQKLIQIGKLQNYIAEEEYKFDLGRLDVVWRRVKQSVPTYVFEINVRGDIYRAIVKVKNTPMIFGIVVFS
jgi:hypothetical protein